MALIHDGLWGIVNETEQAPAPDDNHMKFTSRQDPALATIVLAVEPSICMLYLIGNPKDPIVVWTV